MKQSTRSKEGTAITKMDQLVDILKPGTRDSRKGHTQVLSALTTLKNLKSLKRSLEKNGFSISAEAGNLLQARKGNDVPFYLFFSDEGCIIFITHARKTEDIPGTVMNFIDSTRDVALIRIGNAMMLSIMNSLVQQHQGLRVPFFTARRDPYISQSSAYRKDIERTVIYSGSDGLETFEEMTYHYGIAPRIMEFHLPDGSRFRLDVNGIITLMEGNPLHIVRMVKGIITWKRRMVLPIMCGEGFRKKIEQIGQTTMSEPLITATICSEWDLDTIRDLEHEFSGGWGFTHFSSVIEKGNCLYFTRIMDVMDGTSCEILITGERMNIYPENTINLRMLMQVLEVLDDHLSLTIDPPGEVSE